MHIDPRKVTATGKAITEDNKVYAERLDSLIETAQKVLEGTKHTVRRLRRMGLADERKQDK